MRLKHLRQDIEIKVKVIALCILNNHLICIDLSYAAIPALRLLPFELQPAFYSFFGVAAAFFHYGPLRTGFTECVASKGRLQTPTTPFSFLLYFLYISVCGQHPPHTHPFYLACQEYLYLKYAEMKVEALGVYFVIEVPHATP